MVEAAHAIDFEMVGARHYEMLYDSIRCYLAMAGRHHTILSPDRALAAPNEL